METIALPSSQEETPTAAGAGISAQNIVLRDCKMKDGHGGVTVGSEISGGVRNVFAKNKLVDAAG